MTAGGTKAAKGGFCITFNSELNKKRPQESQGSQRRIWYQFVLRIEYETTTVEPRQSEDHIASILNKT